LTIFLLKSNYYIRLNGIIDILFAARTIQYTNLKR
jgi:hypothetical protein